jgi:hypothetical protein
MPHKRRTRRAPGAAAWRPDLTQDCFFDHRSAFQKYNSTIGFIGFQPSAPLIID